jgi:hypothetical protein
LADGIQIHRARQDTSSCDREVWVIRTSSSQGRHGLEGRKPRRPRQVRSKGGREEARRFGQRGQGHEVREDRRLCRNGEVRRIGQGIVRIGEGLGEGLERP